MLVSELFLAEPQYLVTGQTVEHAARRMLLHDLDRLPVCRPNRVVVGVVSERDVVVKAVARSRACELCAVDEIMERTYPSCLADSAVAAVQARMLTQGLDWLLCQDRAGRLCGVASFAMVSTALDRLAQRPAARPGAAPLGPPAPPLRRRLAASRT
jgi:CBS-domain-containing membrane protein